MTELLGALAAAVTSAGHETALAFDAFPAPRDELVYVVIPHEFDAWGDPQGFPDEGQRASTIALCTENPGTVWFESTFELVPRYAAAVSINRSSAAELVRRGIRCEHLQLGYSPLWDSWGGDEDARRDIDVLYLGAADPRRDPLLGRIGIDLWARNCQFLVPPLEPRTRPRPDFLAGADKYNRLRSSHVLLNLHRTTSSALEWMRFLEAICNGSVVVTEPCVDASPLVANEHFLVAPAAGIGKEIDALLADPGRLQRIRRDAYRFVRASLPMDPAGVRLAELAAELPRQPPAAAPQQAGDADPPKPAPARPAGATRSPAAAATPPTRRGVLRDLTARLRWGSDELRDVVQTPAWKEARPRVSVLAAIWRAGDGADALASVAASRDCDLELLIADGTSDAGRRSTLAFLGGHPMLAATLLLAPPGIGRGAALNALVRRARGERVFILDAAGGIFPATLRRLSDTLDTDRRALFAFPMVTVVRGDDAVELRGALPWEPARLRNGNWIDPASLIDRARLLELGGYSTDPKLAGWEAFELWCRCAHAGAWGLHVPQVLAWSRSDTRLAGASPGEDPDRWALLRERFPDILSLPAGVPARNVG